jgi:RNA polymerase sigma factor (sigma-70 family)
MTAAGRGEEEGPWSMRMLPTPSGPDPPGQAADSDAALIGRSCGQPQAFAAIFDRHAEEVYRYVVGRIGAHAAADVVAEVFMVAFRNRDRYDRDRPDALPWLYGIATRLVGQHRRDERRRLRALARIAAPDAVEGFEEHATDRVMAQQLHPRLARALRRLSAEDRNLLLLVAWGDLTYQQAGQVLGIPIGTVASRLHRIRRKLRRALGHADPAPSKEARP